MIRAWGVLVLTALAAAASAQSVEMDPLRCWWRASEGAVRIGEPFSVVLTCSVVENDSLKVVPDQSPLEPSAMQMPPFEIMGGTHHADLHVEDHRFFQYDYRLRVISEDLFGKDVKIPELKISYRVQSLMNGAAIEGMEKTYFLPPLSIRVLSLVPSDATDIRDATASTFGDIETRLFRANLLVTVAGVLFTIAGLVAILALVRAAGRFRREHPVAKSLVSDAAILRGVGAELAAIRRERRDSGWAPELASRLLTTLRIAAGYALSRPARQIAATADRRSDRNGHDGQLVVRGGWTRGKKVVVCGSVTPHAITEELASLSTNGSSGTRHVRSLDELARALTGLTTGQYGRVPSGDDVLDEALEIARHVVRRLRIEQTWPVRKVRAARRVGVELGQRVWSR